MLSKITLFILNLKFFNQTIKVLNLKNKLIEIKKLI